ncbi:unnamed protein product [Larinioides sclopetarius]|uniref:Secreted protein n=1 Tax=Larinioides sclopetarius TaxID=280406 RepID=A0AAV2B1U7_9ARAC
MLLHKSILFVVLGIHIVPFGYQHVLPTSPAFSSRSCIDHTRATVFVPVPAIPCSTTAISHTHWRMRFESEERFGDIFEMTLFRDLIGLLLEELLELHVLLSGSGGIRRSFSDEWPG